MPLHSTVMRSLGTVRTGFAALTRRSTFMRSLGTVRTGFAALTRLSAPGLRQLEALQNSPLIHRYRLLVALLAVGVVGVWVAAADEQPAAPEVRSRAIAPSPRAGWEEPPLLGFYHPDEHRARQAAPVPERALRRRVVPHVAAEPALPRIAERSVSPPSGAAVRRDVAVPRVRRVARKGVAPGRLPEPAMPGVIISPAVSVPDSLFASSQPGKSDAAPGVEPFKPAAPAGEDLRDGETQIAGLAPRSVRDIDPSPNEASGGEDLGVVEPPAAEGDPVISSWERSRFAQLPWLRSWDQIVGDHQEVGDAEPAAEPAERAPVEPPSAWKAPGDYAGWVGPDESEAPEFEGPGHSVGPPMGTPVAEGFGSAPGPPSKFPGKGKAFGFDVSKAGPDESEAPEFEIPKLVVADAIGTPVAEVPEPATPVPTVSPDVDEFVDEVLAFGYPTLGGGSTHRQQLIGPTGQSLVAIPEPSTLAMIAVGLGGLVFLGRARRR